MNRKILENGKKGKDRAQIEPAGIKRKKERNREKMKVIKRKMLAFMIKR